MSYNNPKLWAQIYEPFARTFGADNVLIAGGCVRDYLHSKRMHPNDIDVFVRFDREIDWEIASIDIDEFSLFDEGRMQGIPGFERAPNEEKYGTMEGSAWIGHGHGYFNTPAPNPASVFINVIARRDVDARNPEAFVNTFDLNICRAWADPSKGFEPQGTDACLYDFQNKTITYGLDDGNVQKSLGRANRINQHLKGKYTLVGFPEKKQVKGTYEIYTKEGILTVIRRREAQIDLQRLADEAFVAGRQWRQDERNDAPGWVQMRDERNERIMPLAHPEPIFRQERVRVVNVVNGVARDDVGQRVQFNPVVDRWEVMQ